MRREVSNPVMDVPDYVACLREWKSSMATWPGLDSFARPSTRASTWRGVIPSTVAQVAGWGSSIRGFFVSFCMILVDSSDLLTSIKS